MSCENKDILKVIQNTGSIVVPKQFVTCERREQVSVQNQWNELMDLIVKVV